MTKFFDQRTIVHAGSLRGPRVYSTDLLPELFDPDNVGQSLQTAARALKVKMLSRGKVTLNGAYLASPMGMLLMRAYPDLLDGQAIIPAILSDKNGLGDLLPTSTEAYAANGISDAQIAEHVALIDSRIHQVMPWEVADVSERYRAQLIEGLSSDGSVIHQELSATGVYDEPRRRGVIDAIAAIDLSRSANLRELIVQEVPEALQALLQRYATACYHSIGTGVVQCETGADLSPLSRFRAADMVLTDRDATIARLSEETIFVRYFMARALTTIQAHNAIPTTVIDDISFENVHKLSAALRETGFQDRYETILEAFASVTSAGDPREALEKLDDAAIAGTAIDLAGMFEAAISKELPNYSTREYEIEKVEMIASGTDVLVEAVNTTPIGNVVAVAKTLQGFCKAVGSGAAALRARSHDKALASANGRRQEDIDEIVKTLGVSNPKKASLLEGIAAMADIQGIANRRA